MARPPRLRIPPNQVPAFKAFRSLSDEDFDRLVDVLRRVPAPADMDSLEDEVAAALPGVEDSGSIVAMLFTMDRIREQRHETPEAIAAELASASGVDLDDQDRVRVRPRLERALSSPGLQLSGKATDLIYANERNVNSIRIITELRPLFEEDPSVSPSAAVIVHRLEINFFGRTGASETR